MTRIRRLLIPLGKLLSLALDGVLLIMSLWFAIGLAIIALVVVIALMYGLRSLF